MNLEETKERMTERYAWPGGYPMYLVMSDGEALCCECAIKEWNLIESSTRDNLHDGWNAARVDINWEDNELYCAHCNVRIESAYAE